MKSFRKSVKRLKERKRWLNSMIKYIKPDKIVEFGCGKGLVLEFLSTNFPKSFIIGIDKSQARLEELAKKRLKNVIPILVDITNPIFLNKSFDTALFIASLHEIFSCQGKRKVEESFRIAHNVLKDNGTLIVQDFLKPLPKLVEMGFRNVRTHKRFLRFAAEFKARKVRFQKTTNRVRLDIADALEFISKYRSPDEADWQEEMNETHFFFTKKDYETVAKKTGFTIINSRKLTKDKDWWSDIRKDIEFEFEAEYQWLQLVLKKTKWR
ncbi:MAG: methyltransferase domain-containing protein [bacterium]